MIRSLRAQLSLTMLTLLLITIALMGFLANRFIRDSFETYVTRQAEERSQAIVSDLGNRFSSLSGWDAEFLNTIGMYSLYGG